MEYILPFIYIIVSAFIGYLFGSARSFRDEKQKAYSELLPPILKMAYDPDVKDEAEFSKGLCKLWLYGSRAVTQKVEEALSILHNPEKGNATEFFQKAIVAMRDDIQILPWQKIKPKDVNHLYTKITQNS